MFILFYFYLFYQMLCAIPFDLISCVSLYFHPFYFHLLLYLYLLYFVHTLHAVRLFQYFATFS